MGMGWHISLHRQISDRDSPSTDGDPSGVRLATWQAGVDGLGWLRDLVQRKDAVHLADNGGYPVRYTVRAGALVPIILEGPPNVRTTKFVAKPSDIVGFDHLPGGAVIDRRAIERCQPDEWLQVEAWDES